MLIQEIVKINDTNFRKTYSDENYRIRKINTEEIYDEAIDVLSSQASYEETDEKIYIEEE